MAQGKRNGGHPNARVAEALDACVTRMRQGESLERCLTDHPEMAGVLRPLLIVAHGLGERGEKTRQREGERAQESAPSLPQNLRRGRERMLAAAAMMRNPSNNGAAQNESAPAEGARRAARVDALDEALAHGPDAVAANKNGRTDIAGLAAFAAGLRTDAVVPPPFDSEALSRGRQRLLDAAALRAEATVASTEDSRAMQTAPTEPHGTEIHQAAAPSAGVLDALDAALQGVSAGLGRHEVLQAHREDPALAAALEPLLDVASRLRDEKSPAPISGEAIARGRTRFLSLAAAARGVAEAAGTLAEPAQSSAEHEWLDVAWAAKAAGTDTMAALRASGAPAEAWPDLRPLLELAFQAQSSTIAAPKPQGQPGRDRFLAVAAQARDHRLARTQANATAKRTRREAVLAGWLSTVRGFVGGGLTAGPRAAVLSLCILLGLVGLNAMAYPAYATTLPGEPLYAMKRLARNTRLAVAGALAPVSPERAADWRTQIERDRVEEVVLLQDDGRKETAEFPGRLAGYQAKGEGDARRGTLHVAVEPEQSAAGPQLVIVDWDGATEFNLPESYGSMEAVPRGAPLSVRVRTGEDRPLALRVRVGLLRPSGVLTATPTTTITITPETPEPGPPGTETTPLPATPTVIAATPTITITQTPLPSPTLLATPTVTVPTATPPFTPTPAPTATPTNGPNTGPGKSESRPDYLVLSGSVLELLHDGDTGRWTLVLRVDDNPDDERKIDVTALANDRQLADDWGRIKRGARISLEVVPRDDGRMWTAQGLAARVKPQSCSNRNKTAYISEYVPGLHLRLHGDDALYSLEDTPADAIQGEPRVDVQIQLRYADCGLGGMHVQQIQVVGTTAPADGSKQPLPRVSFIGFIRSIDLGSTPVRVTIEEYPSKKMWDVEIPGGTLSGGDFADLSVGMGVELNAEVIDEQAGMLRAIELALPKPTAVLPTATQAPPTETPAPTAESPTPTALPDSGPPDGSVLPEPPSVPPPSGDEE